jgi:hypothetical protein
MGNNNNDNNNDDDDDDDDDDHFIHWVKGPLSPGANQSRLTTRLQPVPRSRIKNTWISVSICLFVIRA